MVATTVSRLTDLGGRLERQLHNPASYRAVVTRVLLRTGVSIREPKPGQNDDQVLVAKVAAVLAEMGYRF
jgi:hypothetical protein